MMQILDNTKKKKVIERISYLGIKKVPYLLIKTGTERIRAFSGSLHTTEISKLVYLLSVEGVGLYFGKETEDAGIRLSLDALHLLREQIKENVVELMKEQEELWFKGKNIELNPEQQEKYKMFEGFVAVVSSDEYKDILGTGKISQDKKNIANFLPKERRIRDSSS